MRSDGARQVAEREILGDRAARGIVERHETLLVALAADHNDACVTARRRVASPRRPQQTIDLRHTEDLGQRALTLWPFEDGGGIIAAVRLGVEKQVELPHRREPPGRSGGLKPAPRKLLQIGP